MQNRKAMKDALTDMLKAVSLGSCQDEALQVMLMIVDLNTAIGYKEGQRDALLGTDRYEAGNGS